VTGSRRVVHDAAMREGFSGDLRSSRATQLASISASLHHPL